MPVDPKTLYDEAVAIEVKQTCVRLLNNWGTKDEDNVTVVSYDRLSVFLHDDGDIGIDVGAQTVYMRTADGEQSMFRPGKWMGQLELMHDRLTKKRIEQEEANRTAEERSIRANFEPFDDSSYFKD